MVTLKYFYQNINIHTNKVFSLLSDNQDKDSFLLIKESIA